MRVIFHIDMNAFFANCEIAMHPQLKGKPLAISHDSRRSVVSTASYEARAFGVHSAMPLYMAKKACPDLVVVEPHFDVYRKISHQFMDIVRSYSPIVEPASIDECYCDISHMIETTREQPYDVAWRMQQEIYAKTKIPCSIGISPNKFLAKMASDMKKPMGITILTRSNIREKMWPMPVGEMFGIGKKTAPRLEEAGITTIGDVAKEENYQTLKVLLGKSAYIFQQYARGRDNAKVDASDHDAKSISVSNTYEYDLTTMDDIELNLRALAEDVSVRMQASGVVSNHISVTMKYSIEESAVRSMTMTNYTQNADDIVAYAILIAQDHYDNRPVRLLGIGLDHLVPAGKVQTQMSFYDHDDQSDRKEDLDPTKTLLHAFKSEGLPLMRAADLLKQKEEA